MTTRERNSKLFAPQTLPSDETYEKCAEFEEARLFANCREPRRMFTHWAYPCRMADKPDNVLLVLGEPRSGKSHLVKWCMENWAIGGARSGISRYMMALPSHSSPSFGRFATQYLHAELPKPAFKQFNWHLNHLVRTGTLGEWVEAEHPKTEISDEHLPWTALSDKRPEEEIAPFFLEALRGVAADRPLMLVFDQIEGAQGERLLPVEQFEQLVRRLFLPIAETPSGLLKIAIVATNTQAATFKLTPFPPRYADRVAVHRGRPIASRPWSRCARGCIAASEPSRPGWRVAGRTRALPRSSAPSAASKPWTSRSGRSSIGPPRAFALRLSSVRFLILPPTR
jgi:hypothetical protein